MEIGLLQKNVSLRVTSLKTDAIFPLSHVYLKVELSFVYLSSHMHRNMDTMVQQFLFCLTAHWKQHLTVL